MAILRDRYSMKYIADKIIKFYKIFMFNMFNKSHVIWCNAYQNRGTNFLISFDVYDESTWVESQGRNDVLRREIVDWCNENFSGPWRYGEPEWRIEYNYNRDTKVLFPMYILLDEDAMAFKLRWI